MSRPRRSARVQSRVEAIRSSLFFVPMLFVVAAIALAVATLILDRKISEHDVVLPTLLSATVESARALLSTVAAATMAFAGIAFSVSLLMFQLASSQFSPRVLHGLFRDPLSKRVMGIAVGTFTYCLLVLRVIRKPLEEGGSEVIPHVSVLVALVFGVLAIVAILAFINHVAHSMEAAEIIHRITQDCREQIAKICPDAAGTAPKGQVLGPLPDGPSMEVHALVDGWVQQIDDRRLLSAVSPGGIMRLDTGTGLFAAAGSRLCTIWPSPEDPEVVARHVRAAVRTGRTRTTQQDLALGFRQLVDVALRALSPGINDPTTASEALVHIGSALRELLSRDLPPRVISDDAERRIFRPKDLSYDDYVDLAFDEIRTAGSNQAAVATVLLEVIGWVAGELENETPERAEPVRAKAALVLEAFERSEPQEADAVNVRRVFERLSGAAHA